MAASKLAIKVGVAGGPILVTSSDTVADPNGPFAGMYLDGTTAVKFTDVAGNTCGPISPATNVVHPIPFSRVWATGTTDVTKVYGMLPGEVG